MERGVVSLFGVKSALFIAMNSKGRLYTTVSLWGRGSSSLREQPPAVRAAAYTAEENARKALSREVPICLEQEGGARTSNPPGNHTSLASQLIRICSGPCFS